MAKTPAKTKKPATKAKPAAKPAAKTTATKTAPAKTAAPAARKAASAKKAVPAKKAASTASSSVKKSAAKTETRAVAKPAASQSPAAKKATATTAAASPPSKRPGAVAVARAQTGTAKPAPVTAPLRKRDAGGTVKLPPGYKPKANEEYMSPQQIEYFRLKLLKWREDLIEESQQTIDNLREEVRDVGDEAERAQRETENSLELRTRDRYRKLLAQIDKALKRIEEGEYGFCEETGEPIGIERLEVRPIARFSIDAQERWELRQKHMGE